MLEVLGEQGYDGVSFEAVARRCGTSKASLYRRWQSKRDMVLAAVKNGPARNASEPLEMGTCLREDLLMLVRRLVQTMRSADTGAAFMLLQAGLEDPDLCEAIEDATGPTGARLPKRVIDAAVARGELAPGTDPFAYEEVAGAVLLLRRANGLTLTDEYLQSLVDAVITPALVASHQHTSLPAGIFSGRPAAHPSRENS
ncbi:TetR/AcrR family transcriptional regulator [Phycicoccus endophyticus]|uniref:TetR/AcrR family transcriptional regulator n=1 Tax=Phycicoccus endophyticus TaxID=1690220 RepID=UPI0021CFB6B4|nr:TetR/AcrR family transcriptional regulator [Phycicoccus endophyticus]